MALRSCPDCGNNMVSDKAPTCPICGCPMHTTTTVSNPGRVQQVEQTGKKYKLGILIGACIWLGGCAAPCSQSKPEDSAGMIALSGLGFVVMVVFKIMGWWHHG